MATDPAGDEANSRQATRAAKGDADGRRLDRLSWVRHEIRTPLGAIVSIAELLQATSLDAMQRRLLETLKLSVHSLATIIDDLLARDDGDPAGHINPRVRFDVRDFLANVAVTLSAEAQRKGLAATVHMDEACPSEIVGDCVRVAQVLNILIANALKFTDSGCIDLSVSLSPAATGENSLLFEIADTGCGFPPEQASALFEPGVSFAGGRGGGGLGLAIAKELVLRMGGEIGCRRSESRGSLFWVTIAIEPAAPAETPYPEQLSTRDAELRGHVLIVDDNAINQLLIATMIEEFGLTFDIAANGGDALGAVAEKHYDLILMDALIPDMDGIQAIRRIRAMDGDGALIPIIAVTAKAADSDRLQHLEAGADDFVAKPVKVDALHAAIARQLAKSTQNMQDVARFRGFLSP